MANKPRNNKLKPTGHSAVIEALIQPAIVIGSTLMSAIAAYVLGLDELDRILNGHFQGSDVFVVVLCAGAGFLVDMAIIVSATRYKMHLVRDDPKERGWKRLAQAVLLLGLASESMTMLFFFVHLNPSDFPGFLVWFADQIHSVLVVSRAFLPPVIIAYFVAGIMPVIVERGDRNREIKVRTSQNIMLLIDALSVVQATEDKAEMLKALGGQLILDTYATYDATARTTEVDQMKRDAKLLQHLAKLNGLNLDLLSELLGEMDPEMKAKKEAEEKAKKAAEKKEGTGDEQEVPLMDLSAAR